MQAAGLGDAATSRTAFTLELAETLGLFNVSQGCILQFDRAYVCLGSSSPSPCCPASCGRARSPTIRTRHALSCMPCCFQAPPPSRGAAAALRIAAPWERRLVK